MMTEVAAAESEREPINNTSCFLELECNEVFCRICLEEDVDDLIAPCRCSGTTKWVHRTCLDQWRANHTDRIAFSQCTECLFNYRLRYVGESATLRAAKYWCFVSRDICLLTALVQIVVLVLGLFVWGLDRGDTLLTDLCQQRVGCYFSTYYSSGLILLLMCLGIHGIVLLCLNNCSPQRSIQTYTGDNGNTDNPWASRSRQRQNNTRREPFYGVPGNDCCCCCYCSEDSCRDCCETVSCSCSCPCPSTGRDAELCLIIIAIILVLVGFVVAVVIAVIAFQRILQRHLFRMYKRRLVGEFQVLDLSSMDMEDLERHEVSADESVGLPAAPALSSESVDNLKKLGFME